MNDADQGKATTEIASLIEDWIQRNCENYDVGYWYDEQSWDMARAAVALLAASAKGEERAAEEEDV